MRPYLFIGRTNKLWLEKCPERVRPQRWTLSLWIDGRLYAGPMIRIDRWQLTRLYLAESRYGRALRRGDLLKLLAAVLYAVLCVIAVLCGT